MNTDADYITGLDGWFQGSATPTRNEPFVEVSGTYCIYTSRLTPSQESTLGQLFNALPGALGAPDGSLSYYGVEGSDPEYLLHSFEPSGIVVWGTLSAEHWREWDLSFRKAVDLAGLPRFPA